MQKMHDWGFIHESRRTAGSAQSAEATPAETPAEAKQDPADGFSKEEFFDDPAPPNEKPARADSA
eukprot:CAMPEP_0118937670 /NCGR_PEP_ID=MMETSP1169-20130426/23448_1 /TAXON_ID=36882 /ORGANISM="Pyramimonas obovata, Strain CCMP722" /LENGTH=64 /DNA_ID=CAMNT_0006881375 /DNA_START=614 /DNA_END=805 /DNA_ORIENTATION=-